MYDFFTIHIIHADVKSYEKQGCMYSLHLRMCAYIVEQYYVQIIDDITKLLKNDECIFSCATYESLINENISYEGPVIRYLKLYYGKDNLTMGSVLLEHLENVGWIVLKCDYAISTNSKEPNNLYYLNNHTFKQK